MGKEIADILAAELLQMPTIEQVRLSAATTNNWGTKMAVCICGVWRIAFVCNTRVRTVTVAIVMVFNRCESWKNAWWHNVTKLLPQGVVVAATPRAAPAGVSAWFRDELFHLHALVGVQASMTHHSNGPVKSVVAGCSVAKRHNIDILSFPTSNLYYLFL